MFAREKIGRWNVEILSYSTSCCPHLRAREVPIHAHVRNLHLACAHPYRGDSAYLLSFIISVLSSAAVFRVHRSSFAFLLLL